MSCVWKYLISSELSLNSTLLSKTALTEISKENLVKFRENFNQDKNKHKTKYIVIHSSFPAWPCRLQSVTLMLSDHDIKQDYDLLQLKKKPQGFEGTRMCPRSHGWDSSTHHWTPSTCTGAASHGQCLSLRHWSRLLNGGVLHMAFNVKGAATLGRGPVIDHGKPHRKSEPLLTSEQ